ncbi:uncharacterized protein G2W53_018071 [Senna tora]|uniref:Uncharacterized protein n=1 Tax=Senna tora TaxID=362788 RepID=A0A834TS08_9FABA|nr:uncharacterized protein G2W53_018071 [Senna tora]
MEDGGSLDSSCAPFWEIREKASTCLRLESFDFLGQKRGNKCQVEEKDEEEFEASSSASTGQPQEPVEELQHEVPTNPSQQEGTTDSTSVESSKNFKWLPQYEDRIKACWNFKANERFRGLMKEVRLAWKEGRGEAQVLAAANNDVFTSRGDREQ